MKRDVGVPLPYAPIIPWLSILAAYLALAQCTPEPQNLHPNQPSTPLPTQSAPGASPTPSRPAADTPTAKPANTSTPFPTATTFVGQAFPSVHFDALECPVAFDIPRRWQIDEVVTQLYPDSQCKFGIRPPEWPPFAEQAEVSLNEHPILIVVYQLPVEEAAKYALMFRDAGTWILSGRSGYESFAEVATIGNRTIIRGFSVYGLTSRTTHSYAGLAFVQRAVVTEGSTPTLIIEADDLVIPGSEPINEVFDMILHTLEFEPGP